MPTKTKLQRAVEALGMFYGTLHRDSFVTFLQAKENYEGMLTRLGTNTEETNTVEARKQAVAKTLSGWRTYAAQQSSQGHFMISAMFWDLTSGGRTTYDILMDASGHLPPNAVDLANDPVAASEAATGGGIGSIASAKHRPILISGGACSSQMYQGNAMNYMNVQEMVLSGYNFGRQPNDRGTVGGDCKPVTMQWMAGGEGTGEQITVGGRGLHYIPSMSAILRGRTEDVNDIPRWIAINDGDGSFKPTKLKPQLALIQMMPVEFNYCNRDTGAVSLFMNAIPTIEMSRCVPFLDITLISPRAAIRGTPGQDATLSSLSLAKVLMGRAKIEPPSSANTAPQAVADYALAAAVPVNLMGSKGFPSLMNLIKEQAEQGKLGMSSAGMELFCSPQTLTNADETYNENIDGFALPVPAASIGPLTSGDSEGVTRKTAFRPLRDAPIIDKFRPFASVEQFTVTVNPGAGLQSYKTAELEVRLHDRSRMSELADFIRPDQYGTTEVYIEHGWSHPDGNPLSQNENNVFGTFLDCMRVKEKWRIVNSTFSFTEAGEVKIKLKLVMAGASDIFSTSLMEGEGLEPLMTTVNKLTEAISIARKKLTEETSSVKGLSVPEVITVAGSTDGALTMSAAQRGKLQRFIHQNRTSTNPSLTELRELLEELHGKDGKGGVVNKVNEDILSIIKRKLSRLTAGQTIDPFRKATLGSGTNKDKSYREFRTVRSNKWCSLGKILMIFMGVPLTSTHKFDEVQIITYAMNKFSSYVRNHNISNFPILISEFKTQFEAKIKINPQITVGEFGQWLINTFINTHTAKAYGLSTFYTMKEGSDTVNSTYKNMTKLGEATAKVLSDAYGTTVKPGSEKNQFKLPNVKITYECVGSMPTLDYQQADGAGVGRTSGQPGDVAGNTPGTLEARSAIQIEDQLSASASDVTILRIHVYDEQTSSYECASQLLDGARDDAMGSLTLPIGTPTPAEMKRLHQGGLENVSGRGKNRNVVPSIQEMLAPHHWSPFRHGLRFLMENNVIEALPRELAPNIEEVFKNLDKLHWRIKGGFSGIKKWIMETTPSIIYGSQMSAVTSAQLSSLNDAEHASIQILTSENETSGPEGHADKGVPMTMFPIELTLDIFGCPLINFAQKFFIDFGTGTSVDNIYYVTGLTHTLQPGGFKTQVKMKQENALGKYISMMDRLEEGIATVHEMTKLREIVVREVSENQLKAQNEQAARNARAVRAATVKDARRKIRDLEKQRRDLKTKLASLRDQDMKATPKGDEIRETQKQIESVEAEIKRLQSFI